MLHEHVEPRIGESAPFHFESVWRINASAAAVWSTLMDIDAWPKWWPGVTSARMFTGQAAADGLALGDGRIRAGSRGHLEIRSRLGFSLRFDIELQKQNPPSCIEFSACGDLRGFGRWTFVEEGPVTTVSVLWCVTTTRPLIRMLRPLAAWTHAMVMDAGNRGLNVWLSRSAT